MGVGRGSRSSPSGKNIFTYQIKVEKAYGKLHMNRPWQTDKNTRSSEWKQLKGQKKRTESMRKEQTDG